MKLRELRNRKWFRIISNKYVLILLLFAFWMFFLDSNSWLVHHELDQEINELETNKKFYQQEIAKDRSTTEKLNDSFELESFARQQYFMKRPGEEIFIIEYDSIK